MQMKRAYMTFYLEGRADEDDDPVLAEADELDIEKLAEKAMDGPDDVHTVITGAVTALAAPLEHGKDKRDWIADHKDEIRDAGGDAEEAYRHYCKGTIDEAVNALTDDVLEAMTPEEEDDEDEDEEEEG